MKSDPLADLFGETKSPKPKPEPAPEAAVDLAAAAAAEAALTAAADAYESLLPDIEAAHPLLGAVTVEAPLAGVAYAVDAWRRLLSDAANLAEWDIPAFDKATVSGKGDAVTVVVTGANPATARQTAEALIVMAERRGNLGRYCAVPGGTPGVFTLVRRGVEDVTGGWASESKTRAFHGNPQYRAGVWNRCGLTAADAKDRLLHPKVSFGSDDRGGTAALTLPPGLLPAKVQAAEQALRQALGQPELAVTVDGLRPVIHLNSRPIAREFPKSNPLRPSMFTRPRKTAERFAAAPDFVLPLGVRADGSPILVSQAKVPHALIAGGTGAGKTVLLTSLVEAAVLQGADVILADAKAGKDLRNLAIRARAGELPGVVHYAAGSEAALHRAVLYAHDELAMRKAVAQRLSQRGIEYRPTPLLFVFDEWGAWIDACISGSDKDARKAAEETVSRMSYLAAQSREMGVYLLVSGQHVYVSAISGPLKANLTTLAVIGPPQERHLQALFDGERRKTVKELTAATSSAQKGRGVVVNSETGSVDLFQGFYTPPGRDADALASSLRQAPKLRRFGWRHPVPGEPGGDGTWQSWTPVSDPSSDELQTIWLDSVDGAPDPSAARFDPASKDFRPGTPPIHRRHLADTE